MLNIFIRLLLEHLNQTFIDHITDWEQNMQSCEVGKRYTFDFFLKKWKECYIDLHFEVQFSWEMKKILKEKPKFPNSQNMDERLEIYCMTQGHL